MSSFNDYDTASRAYDKHRNAAGADTMMAMMQFYCGKSLKDLHVLDAGCGTGNYAKHFLDRGIGQVTLLDSSVEMIDLAKEHLAYYIASGRVANVTVASLPTMPYEDKHFDAVVFNLVLHYLDHDNDDRTFTNIVWALREAKRLLKPNGVIVISTLLPDIVKHSIWVSQLNPDVTERYVKVYPNMDEFNRIIDSADLQCVQKLNILGESLMKDRHNFEGPLDDIWRQANSYWTLATEDESNEMKQFVKDLKDRGELESWVRQHNHTDTTGGLTLLVLSEKC